MTARGIAHPQSNELLLSVALCDCSQGSKHSPKWPGPHAVEEQICCHQCGVGGELLDLPWHWEALGSETFPVAARDETQHEARSGLSTELVLPREEKEDCCESRNYIS